MNASTDIIAVRSLLPERAFDAAAIEAAFMRWLAHMAHTDFAVQVMKPHILVHL